MSTVVPVPPRRLFLDAGVVVEGCLQEWGSAKGVLVLATLRERYTIVLAAVVEREIGRAFVRAGRTPMPSNVDSRLVPYFGWLRHVRLERWPSPSEQALRRHMPAVLPVLRHANDLPGVVSTIEAQPDWVISSNDAHWSPALAARTGLRIATPRAFLEQISEWAARYEQSRQPGATP